MKYFPLVWAALMRKPAAPALTLLSVMIAFTLFGLTIGMNATFDKSTELARDDRIYVHAALRRRRLPDRHGAADRRHARRGEGRRRRVLLAAITRIRKNRVFV